MKDKQLENSPAPDHHPGVPFNLFWVLFTMFIAAPAVVWLMGCTIQVILAPDEIERFEGP